MGLYSSSVCRQLFVGTCLRFLLNFQQDFEGIQGFFPVIYCCRSEAAPERVPGDGGAGGGSGVRPCMWLPVSRQKMKGFGVFLGISRESRGKRVRGDPGMGRMRPRGTPRVVL